MHEANSFSTSLEIQDLVSHLYSIPELITSSLQIFLISVSVNPLDSPELLIKLPKNQIKEINIKIGIENPIIPGIFSINDSPL